MIGFGFPALSSNPLTMDTDVRLRNRLGTNVDAQLAEPHPAEINLTLAGKHNVIKLPLDRQVPDGTKVVVSEVPVRQEVGKWILAFAGSIDGLPEDFAADHDHYLQGTPKRTVR